MVETVGEFKARVNRLRKLYPHWRKGQTFWNAMAFPDPAEATPGQKKWVQSLEGPRIAFDPYFDDSKIPAFIDAALKAGVLREDDDAQV